MKVNCQSCGTAMTVGAADSVQLRIVIARPQYAETTLDACSAACAAKAGHAVLDTLVGESGQDGRTAETIQP